MEHPWIVESGEEQQIVEYLHNKLDICAIQETKTKFEEMQTIGENDLIFFGNKNLGMGFIVRNDLNYIIVDDKSERICVKEIEKKSEFE